MVAILKMDLTYKVRVEKMSWSLTNILNSIKKKKIF